MGSVIRNTGIPLLAVLLGCSPARVDPSGTAASDSVVAAVRAAIERTNANYVASYMRGDAAAAASGYYAADAVVMRPGQSDLVGRPSIEADITKAIASQPDSMISAQLTTRTLDVAGDRAWEYGTVTFVSRPRANPRAEPSTKHLKYVTFWRRDPDGAWRATRDLGVADSPPTQ